MEPLPDTVDGPDLLARCTPPMAALYRFWDARRRGRPMPARADLDVVDLKPWLGFTGLLDVLPDALPEGADFRYRLIGTALTGHFGVDLTGQCVSKACLTANIPAALANLRGIVAGRRARWRNDLVPCNDGTSLSGERLFLPLSDDGESVNMILFHTTRPRLSDGSPAPDARAQFWRVVG
ncbi:MAG: PAS domain-containing protein [Proteobacteria bacterium]|nr:PAS domain-containing protein [Pseudomonadota bacterium]